MPKVIYISPPINTDLFHIYNGICQSIMDKCVMILSTHFINRYPIVMAWQSLLISPSTLSRDAVFRPERSTTCVSHQMLLVPWIYFLFWMILHSFWYRSDAFTFVCHFEIRLINWWGIALLIWWKRSLNRETRVVCVQSDTHGIGLTQQRASVFFREYT